MSNLVSRDPILDMPSRLLCDEQSRPSSDSTLQQVLHPSAKEKLFWHGDKNKNAGPGKRRFARCRHVSVRMDEAERNSQHEHCGREKQKLAQARLPVVPMQVEIKSSAAQAADSKKRVQTRIHQQQIIQPA